MRLYVPIHAFLAATTVIADVAVPPACKLIPVGLNEADMFPVVNCATRDTVPE